MVSIRLLVKLLLEVSAANLNLENLKTLIPLPAPQDFYLGFLKLYLINSVPQKLQSGLKG